MKLQEQVPVKETKEGVVFTVRKMVPTNNQPPQKEKRNETRDE